MYAAEETPSVSGDSILGILRKVSAAPERRAGLDLTLSAPKSVSLQALVFGDTRLIEAHRGAVREAMKYVEERFSQCRIGPRGERQIVTTGKLAIAHFEHDLSREKDPHLHTHNVVINMTPYDGKMRALHNDELFQHKRLIGTIYRSELALRVRHLGYDVVLGKEGTFEIAGFQREQIEAFSQRHMQMWRGEAKSQAEVYENFYEGRKTKEVSLDRTDLAIKWRAVATTQGIVPVHKGNTQGIVFGAPKPSLEAEVASLTEKSVLVRIQDLQTARLASSLGQTPSNLVLAECEEFARTQLVPGIQVRTFTTEEALLREKDYRADVERGIGAFQPFSPLTAVDALEETLARRNIVSPEFRSRALTEAQESIALVVKSPTLQKAVLHSLGASLEPGKKLSPKELYCLRREVEGHLRADGKKGKERTASLRTILDPFEKQMQAMTRGQIAAVVSTLKSRDGVVVWQGVAGAGKTFSLNQLARVVESHGYVVRGLAPSAAAAKQLGRETRLFTETVDVHLLRNSEKGTLPELWIVDEAGMLSAKNFAALSSKAHSQGARLLLVGDTRQISSVEAGNPFLDVQRNTKTTVVSLSESIRPRTPLLQETVTKLYAKDARGVSWGLRKETLEAPTKEERCTLVTAAYLAISPRERAQTLVIAKTNEERRLLTEGIRSGLRASGKLGLEAKVTTLRALDYTEIQKKQIQNFVPGLVLKLNDSSKRSLKRDEAFVVVGKDFSKNALVVKDDRGRQRLLSCESLGSASVFRQETLGLAKGDRVLWTRNDRRAGAMNNDLFEVSRVSKSGITLKPAEGTTALRQKLPFEGLHHVDHAWAMTVHRSQGQTAKHVLLVADERTTASDLLVGLTRATQSVLVVAHDRTAIEKIAARESEKEVAHEVALPRIELAADVERSSTREQPVMEVEWGDSI
ncbi:MAG: relaxase domain-containing protein [Rhodocyclaceae bacterium]|nr:relaxase domain-containing protein [Rhodocyclaceae bacterium]